ncbi:MAG: MEKHLA domain-containing protein [Planctomycetaceae bacterium]|nr:MEKHLA domain-containing protein [Planctomycetaceae bacterium]
MTNTPCQQPEWIEQTQIILNSYAELLGRELIDRDGSKAEQSQRLFDAPFVVVSHNTADDPILNYGNHAALLLWEADLKTLLQMPSRKTAEPVHRDERSELLRRVTENGFIDDYQGIRISATGQRFQIDQAIVWNLTDSDGNPAGQAATFTEWEMLGYA